LESFGKKSGYWTGWNYRIYFGSLFLAILTCYIIINIWASILYCKAKRSSSHLIKLCVAADKPLINMDQRQWSPPCNLQSQDKSLYLRISKSLSHDFKVSISGFNLLRSSSSTACLRFRSNKSLSLDFIFSDLRLPPPVSDSDLISYKQVSISGFHLLRSSSSTACSRSRSHFIQLVLSRQSSYCTSFPQSIFGPLTFKSLFASSLTLWSLWYDRHGVVLTAIKPKIRKGSSRLPALLHFSFTFTFLFFIVD